MITYGVCSLYANPLHQGHIEYLTEADKHCNFLIAIINNDKQVELKKSTPFMDQSHRAFIVDSIKGVDGVMISIDEDSSVSKTLDKLHLSIKLLHENLKRDPDFDMIFFNSGDRNEENQNDQELEICKRLDIRTMFLDLPKKYSSSKLKLSR